MPCREAEAEGYGNLCVCLPVIKKKKTTNIGGSNELFADFKLYKEQKEQQAFGYKVMTIYITHSFCFQT